MRRSCPVARVDVFADRPLAGNPAAAVLDADGLDDALMQAIAGELRAPGTAFVSASTRPGVDFRLRTFTPAREVGYSGHTTLGAVRALLDAGRLTGDRVVFATTPGPLPVAIERRADGAVLWLEPATPACAPAPALASRALDALGLAPDMIGGWAPAAVTPETDLLIPVRDLSTLHAIVPDSTRLAAVGRELGLRAFCLVSRETVETGSASHCRFFAPQFGIPEDLVTGSVHSSIAVWLLGAGCVRVENGLAAFTAEQGDVLGRPGRLAIELRVRHGQVAGVRVGGRAVAVASGRLALP